MLLTLSLPVSLYDMIVLLGGEHGDCRDYYHTESMDTSVRAWILQYASSIN